MSERQDKIVDPATWRVATPADHVQFLEGLRTQGRRPHSRWVNDGSLSPLDLYAYLRARFGLPNGTAMPLREASTDNLLDWDYAVISGGAYIDILGTRSQTEVNIHSPFKLQPRHWSGFVSNLTTEFATWRKRMNDAVKEFERWMLFVNPYCRLRMIAFDLERQALALDLREPSRPLYFTSEEASSHYIGAQKEFAKTLHAAQTVGLCLRMLVPVLAEAFVNMLLFILAKPELKADERLMESVTRSNVDVRVKGLSLHCEGFARSVDQNAEEFKAFCRIMNHRNDLLHGNVDPLRLTFDEVYFDLRFIPLFKDQRSLFSRLMASGTRHVEPRIGLEELAAIRRFASWLLDHLETRHRKQVTLLLDNPYPGWRRDKQRLGLLFGETLYDVNPVSSPHATSADSPSA